MKDLKAPALAAQAAFEEWLGEVPAQRLVPTETDGRVEIWALLFDGNAESAPIAEDSGVVPRVDEEEPEEPQDEYDDEPGSDAPLHYVTTAGLSAAPVGPSSERFELVVPVCAPIELTELQPLAHFVRAAGQIFAESDSPLDRHLLIEVGEIPLFSGMTWLMVSPWDSNAHTVLPGMLPEVTLLCANPIYAGEAEIIQSLPMEQVLVWFRENGVDLDDPFRPDVSKPGVAPSNFELTNAMNQMILDIGMWAQNSMAPDGSAVRPEEFEDDE